MVKECCSSYVGIFISKIHFVFSYNVSRFRLSPCSFGENMLLILIICREDWQFFLKMYVIKTPGSGMEFKYILFLALL